MQPSPLKLVHYHLVELDIKPEEKFDPHTNQELGYPDFTNADFSAKIRLATPEGETDPYEFMVKLELEGHAQKKKEGLFPYRFSIGAEGIVRYSGDKTLDDRKELVVVNGSAMLYGALREQLLSITGRFQHGPMMLPTVNFLDLRRKKTDTATAAQDKNARVRKRARKKAEQAT